MLVGRTAEQEAARAVLSEAFAGRTRVLCIEGEAGIGKSALLGALRDDAVAAGAVTFVGRAEELARARPFAPLIDAGVAGPLHDSAAADGAAERARAIPLASGPEARTVLIDRIIGGIEELALQGPLMIGLDDAQWADEATLLCAAAVVRRCIDLPLALVCTFRPGPRSRELAAFLSALDRAPPDERAIVHLTLPPLAADDVAAITESLAGAPPGEDLRALLDGCSGNPLLVVETVSSLCDEGAIVERGGFAVRVPSAADDLPLSLHETVRRRMVPLEGDIRAVAAVAALLGARFTLADLVAVTGRSATELYQHVQELIDAQLLVDDGDALAFRHDLVRDAVATLMAPSVRAELHQAIADGLRGAGAPVERVAEHLALAAPTGAAETIEVLRRAAAEIVMRDPSAATRLLRRAVDQCPASDPVHDELMALLVDALAWSGRTVEAQAIAIDALTRPLSPAIEEQLRSSLSRSLLLLGRPVEAIEHAERVVLLRESLGRSSAWAQAECAMCLLFAVEIDASLARAEIAAAAARRDGDAEAEILALCVETFARNTVGDTATAVERGDAAVRRADETPGGAGHRLHPHLFRGVALETLGLHDAAAASFREGRARGEALGASWALPIYHFVTGLAHWDAGRWDDTLAEIDAGISLGEDEGSTIARLWAFAVAGLVHLHRGELDAAAVEIGRGDEVLASGGMQFGVNWFVHSKALLLEGTGDARGALELMRLGWDAAVGLQAASALTTFGPELARMARLAGDSELASAVVAELSAVADAHPNDAIASGRTLHARGLVERDATTLQAAAAIFDRLGHRFETAIIRAEIAAELTAAGEHDAAIVELERALTVFDAIGALPDADRARAVLRRLQPGRTSGPAPSRAVEGWDSLTRTELEVVEEVCGGRSNAQVAERLGVSRRTVEAHLRSVYRKLQVPTRLGLSVSYRERSGARRSSTTS